MRIVHHYGVIRVFPRKIRECPLGVVSLASSYEQHEGWMTYQADNLVMPSRQDISPGLVERLYDNQPGSLQIHQSVATDHCEDVPRVSFTTKNGQARLLHVSLV